MTAPIFPTGKNEDYKKAPPIMRCYYCGNKYTPAMMMTNFKCVTCWTQRRYVRTYNGEQNA